MDMRGLALALLTLVPLTLWGTAAAGSGNADAIAQAVDSIPAAELQSFARAAREVFRVRQAYATKVQAAHSEIEASGHVAAAQKEMEAAIQHEGMTVARYNQILEAAQRNGTLAARIQKLVDKAAQGQ